jgi:SAM-dependent methyltransferase
VTDRYLAENLANWDERAAAHAASPEYDVAAFANPGHLSKVVRFDLPRLGDISGLRGVHLQCHIGTDTVSLARLGAHMTGLDFSGASLTEAARIAELAGVDVDFVQSDVHDAVQALGAERFDLVFTGIGALCWVPQIRPWARLVHDLLVPGGRLFVREGHPYLWSLDERVTDGAPCVGYSYFETTEPITDVDEGSYVSTEQPFANTVSHSWNHGLGEIVSALLEVGMQITMLEEHDSVHWEALPGRMTEGDDGEWRLTDGTPRIPLTYTLQAVRA